MSTGRDKPTDAEGGLWSTVHDLGRWIGFQLDGDETILTARTLREMQRPQVLTDDSWTAGQGSAGRRNDGASASTSVTRAAPSGSASAWPSVSPTGSAWWCSRTVRRRRVRSRSSLIDELVDASRAHPRVASPDRSMPLPEGYRDLVGLVLLDRRWRRLPRGVARRRAHTPVDRRRDGP